MKHKFLWKYLFILFVNVTYFRDLNKGGAGGTIAPPHFGRIEGAAGQRRRAALLLAPPVLGSY